MTCTVETSSSGDDIESADDTSDSSSNQSGWTTSDAAFKSYETQIYVAGQGAWDRHDVTELIGDHSSFDFKRWKSISEMERFHEINSHIRELRKRVRIRDMMTRSAELSPKRTRARVLSPDAAAASNHAVAPVPDVAAVVVIANGSCIGGSTQQPKQISKRVLPLFSEYGHQARVVNR